jgi:hypothetical protein
MPPRCLLPSLAAIWLAVLLLGACSSQPQPAALPQRPVVMVNPAVIAKVPETGPITPPAEPADAAAMLAEGLRYLRGEGVAKDYARALALFQQAAERGSPSAHHRIGVMYLRGTGVPVDEGKAADLLMPLALQGYGDSAFVLGLIATDLIPAPGFLPLGRGKLQQAPYWFNIARRAGQGDARTAYAKQLEAMRQDGVIPEGDGSGDDIHSAIRFKNSIKSTKQGMQMEQAIASSLFPGWLRESQNSQEKDGKRYEVLTLVNGFGQKVRLYFDITDRPADAAAGA